MCDLLSEKLVKQHQRSVDLSKTPKLERKASASHVSERFQLFPGKTHNFLNLKNLMGNINSWAKRGKRMRSKGYSSDDRSDASRMKRIPQL